MPSRTILVAAIRYYAFLHGRGRRDSEGKTREVKKKAKETDGTRRNRRREGGDRWIAGIDRKAIFSRDSIGNREGNAREDLKRTRTLFLK